MTGMPKKRTLPNGKAYSSNWSTVAESVPEACRDIPLSCGELAPVIGLPTIWGQLHQLQLGRERIVGVRAGASCAQLGDQDTRLSA
jgi:hypothetical protein